MTDQIERARTFRALHVKGNPIVLYNAWDPGSAKIVEKAGAKAIATGSWPVAAAFGYAMARKSRWSWRWTTSSASWLRSTCRWPWTLRADTASSRRPSPRP